MQVKLVRKIADGRFSVRTSAPRVEVSWQVTGVRQDPFALAHPIRVEEEKPPADRGKRLHPEVYGLPPELRASGSAVPEAPPLP